MVQRSASGVPSGEVISVVALVIVITALVVLFPSGNIMAIRQSPVIVQEHSGDDTLVQEPDSWKKVIFGLPDTPPTPRRSSRPTPPSLPAHDVRSQFSVEATVNGDAPTIDLAEVADQIPSLNQSQVAHETDKEGILASQNEPSIGDQISQITSFQHLTREASKEEIWDSSLEHSSTSGFERLLSYVGARAREREERVYPHPSYAHLYASDDQVDTEESVDSLANASIAAAGELTIDEEEPVLGSIASRRLSYTNIRRLAGDADEVDSLDNASMEAIAGDIEVVPRKRAGKAKEEKATDKKKGTTSSTDPNDYKRLADMKFPSRKIMGQIPGDVADSDDEETAEAMRKFAVLRWGLRAKAAAKVVLFPYSLLVIIYSSCYLYHS